MVPTLVSAALLVTVLRAQLRVVTSGPSADRRAILSRHVGRHVTIVERNARSCQGLVRRVGRREVAVRVTGSEISVPFDAIDEVWDGQRLLARW